MRTLITLLASALTFVSPETRALVGDSVRSSREAGLPADKGYRKDPASEAARILVSPETTDLSEDTNRLVVCQVSLVDAKGVKVTDDRRVVDFIAEGACRIVSSDARSFTIRRTRPGAANVRAVAEGLLSGEYTFADNEEE